MYCQVIADLQACFDSHLIKSMTSLYESRVVVIKLSAMYADVFLLFSCIYEIYYYYFNLYLKQPLKQAQILGDKRGRGWIMLTGVLFGFMHEEALNIFHK